MGDIGFIGSWWDTVPAGAAELGVESAFGTDPQWLRRLRIEVRPSVPYTEVDQGHEYRPAEHHDPASAIPRTEDSDSKVLRDFFRRHNTDGHDRARTTQKWCMARPAASWRCAMALQTSLLMC